MVTHLCDLAGESKNDYYECRKAFKTRKCGYKEDEGYYSTNERDLLQKRWKTGSTSNQNDLRKR